MTQYAVYQGDDFLFMGTLQECAKEFDVDENSIRFMASPSYLKRLESKGRDINNCRVAVKVEDDE